MFNDSAYVIYVAHFQESSALVKLISCQHGVISAIARGVYSATKKSTHARSSLQLGNLIECQWGGKASLKTLYQMELVSRPYIEDSKTYLCLSYVHELMLHFLQESISAERVYLAYSRCLQLMAIGKNEIALRHFELDLLEELGYSMDFNWDVEKEQMIDLDKNYNVYPGHGVVENYSELAIKGCDLSALQNRAFESTPILLLAKKVNRLILSFYLEGKVIKSREMYQALLIS